MDVAKMVWVQRTMVRNRKGFWLGTLVAVLGVFVGFFLFVLFWPNSAMAPEERKVVIVQPGMNVYEIGRLLADRGIIRYPGRFVLAAKILGVAKELKAGRYEIPAEKSGTVPLIQLLYEGRVAPIRVTIPEGFTARQIAQKFSRELTLDSTRFMRLVQDSAFCRQLGIPALSLEGFLFPDTYFFQWREKEENVIRRMVSHFFEVVPDSVIEAASQRGLSIVELVTLGSIIQGEAMVEEEMALISAVYHNRLKRGMLLQADPTLQYIIPDGPRRLTNADKRIDSPYNTYLYPGLPPGPINNPGLSAIRAASAPADVPYLYFVANGDGTHTFSRTLGEHLRAKKRLDQIRRQVYGKKRIRRGE